MQKESIIRIKSYEFALKIARFSKQLTKEKEFHISNQLFRSGTAIGALVEEAAGAQTGKDFYHKLSIAYKEALESKYWLRLISDLELNQKKQGDELLYFNEEILKILASILMTMKKKLINEKGNNGKY